MPVVPTEQNKVGIAGVTGAKLEAGDFSGSGLQAIGGGLRQVGGGLGELEKAQEAEDDAAIKRAYNHYAETVRPFVYEGNDALADKQGGDAVAMAPIATQRVYDAAKAAETGLKPRLLGSFRATMAPRVDQDIRWIQLHAGAATKVSQTQQSDQVIGNCKSDAIVQHNSPAYEPTVATGVNQIAEQVAAGALTPEAGAAKKRDYLSGINLGVIARLATSDPVLGHGLLQQQGASMTHEHHEEASQALQGPLDQARGIADVDSLGFAQSPVAPETPPGDLRTTGQRMLAITPESAAPADPEAGETAASQAQSGASAQPGSPPAGTGNLPALLQHYGGDAAKAWAAWRLGNDAVDALVATHGGTWFGALPDDTRKAVAADMGLLRAAISPRAAPSPGDRAALAEQIDDQTWLDDRKRNAHDELHTRIGLADRRLTEAQKGAADRSFRLADTLGPKFTSINQIPPADRLALDDDTRAALTLRAYRNVHPVTVPPHGDVAMDLNRMAATDPQAFAKQDLRLFRDRMSPVEYDALGRVQQAWSGYPPGPAGINQQRTVEKVRASGLDVVPASDLTGGQSATPNLQAPNGAGPVDPTSGVGDITAGQPTDIAVSPGNQPAQPGIDVRPGNPALTPRVVPATYLRPASGEEHMDSDGPSVADQATLLPVDLSVGTSAVSAAVPSQAANPAPAPLGADLSTLDPGFGGLGYGVKGDYRTPPQALAWTDRVLRQAGDDTPYPDGTPGSTMASVAARRKIRAEVAYFYTLPEVKAFLDALSFTEGTSGLGYFTSHWPSTEKLPDLNSFHGTVPSGRYQITLKNWQDYGEGWWSRKDFSPISQDIVAITLLRQNDIIKDLMAGNLSGAFSKAALVFASIPMSSKKDYSAYIGGTLHTDNGPTSHPPRQLSPVRFNALAALYVDRLNRRRQEFNDAKRAWETNKTIPYAFISPLKWQSLGTEGF